MNMGTCSGYGTVTAPVTLLKGTGLYAGISGTVQITETFAFIGPKYTTGARKGRCNQSDSAQPLAQYGAIIGIGTVTFS